MNEYTESAKLDNPLLILEASNDVVRCMYPSPTAATLVFHSPLKLLIFNSQLPIDIKLLQELARK